MAEECCSQTNNFMILSCSGCANVGQLANQAAVELTLEGFGKMYCLAGIGARLSPFIQSAKDAPFIVAIDGCQIGCTKKTLEDSGLSIENYLLVTDQGVEKNKDLNLKREDIDKVKVAVKNSVGGKGKAVSTSTTSTCCCSG